MPCIDDFDLAHQRQRRSSRRRAVAALAALAVLALAGCATAPPTTPPAAATAGAPAAAATARPPRFVKLPPPPVPRNWDELKLNAAQRLVAAHPDTSYVGSPPEPLLAIPVLEIELHADGSVRRIEVVREPREVKETIQIAIEAVHRAAPYGDVSRLPRPWRFVEVFLFDDDLRFMPATLDR